MTNYEAAREKYAALGVDTDKAIETLKKVPVSLHCWQLDDVIGFDNDGGLTGGIQTTGNYMGRARTPEQLMAYGRSDETDAGNRKIKHTCILCNLCTGGICRKRCA